MTLSGYINENVAQIVSLREAGKKWEEVATHIEAETGDSVNVSSLKKAFARATAGKVAAAKRVKKSSNRIKLNKIPEHEISSNQNNNKEVYLKIEIDELEARLKEYQDKYYELEKDVTQKDNLINKHADEINKLKSEISNSKIELEPDIKKLKDESLEKDKEIIKIPNYEKYIRKLEAGKKYRNWIIIMILIIGFIGLLGSYFNSFGDSQEHKKEISKLIDKPPDDVPRIIIRKPDKPPDDDKLKFTLEELIELNKP